MKKIRALLCVVMATSGAAVGAHADDATEVTRLTVTLTSGTQEHYDFPDHPEVTFPDSRMQVKSDVAETAYERADVASYSFTRGQRNSALEQVGAGEYLFGYSDGRVTVSGRGITTATVYTPAGTAVLSASATDGGVITIDLTEMPAGVYIVSPAGHTAIKIKK